jgi:myo-inositol-1(or 4)-monophosphatase
VEVYPDVTELAERVVRATTQELLPRFADSQRYHKADGSIVTAADIAIQRRLEVDLAAHWPQYGFLGEEMDQQAQRDTLLDSGRGFWCLDPLDGTSNFAAGIPFFSVSLALLVRGEPVLGVVCDPARGEQFTARAGAGAWLNGAPLRTLDAGLPLRGCIAVVDFKRLGGPLATRLVSAPPYASQRNFGSCALEWCWLAASRFHLYLHGGQKLWDHAAGSLILREAGGFAATLEGTALSSRSLRPQSVLAALDEPTFHAWRQAVRG